MAPAGKDVRLLGSADGEHFLLGQADVYRSALVVAKELLDPIARRSCDLTQLSVDGFDVNQIYEQAKFISESAVGEIMSVAELQDHHRADGEIEDASPGDSSADLTDDSNPLAETFVSGSDDVSDFGEEGEDENDGANVEDGVEGEEESSSEETPKAKEQTDGTIHPMKFKKDVHGLNDGFFDIDDFNRQTELMEQMSDGDDDEIDFDKDPDEQTSDVEEDAGALMYNDFFHAPKLQKKKASKARGLAQDDEDGLEAAMGAMKRDLFDQASDTEEEVSKESRHTKRKRELAEEIRQLEEANVAKKQWTLMGEARAADRPMNSLLEEDLDFERARKPVPVVTQETIDSLEDMIKQRIRDGNFDSLKKKRVEDVVEFQPKRGPLSANKSDKSLAQIYEESHLAKTDPNFVNTNDAKRDQEYTEIIDLVANVNKKLDSLSNWHFTPKAPKASLRITTNAPAISMEDAQPTGVSTATLVAPQEVHKVQRQEGEVIRGGLPVSKEEMNRDERRRQRRREKHARHKAAEERERTRPANKRAAERENVRDALKLGNVTVIGKKGEKRNIDGKLVSKKPGLPQRATFYKM